MSVLHPFDTDRKTVEIFACPEGVGVRLLSGQTERFTPRQWEAIKADAEALLREHAIRHAALS